MFGANGHKVPDHHGRLASNTWSRIHASFNFFFFGFGEIRALQSPHQGLTGENCLQSPHQALTGENCL